MRVLVKTSTPSMGTEPWRWRSCGFALLDGAEPDWRDVARRAELLAKERASRENAI